MVIPPGYMYGFILFDGYEKSMYICQTIYKHFLKFTCFLSYSVSEQPSSKRKAAVFTAAEGAYFLRKDLQSVH